MGYLSDNDIQGVCLDIDGTLYPRWMMDLFLALSFFPDPRLGLRYNSVRKHYRRSQDAEPPRIADRSGLLEKQALLFLDGKGGEARIRHMTDKVNRQFYDSWKHTFRHIHAYRDMAETLDGIRHLGIKILAISDFPLENKLSTLHIKDIVDYAISSEDTGFLKPSKVPFQRICALSGLDPSRCLYCGDSYDKDVLGAKQVGMFALLLKKNARRDAFPAADLICSNWKEISRILLD